MDETKLSPYPPRAPPQKADFTLKFMVNKTGPSTWVLNAAPHEFFRQNVPPILWNEASRGKTSWGNENGFLKNGSVVDLIIENGAEIDSNHPFHKHNHKVWVIGQGDGGFPWDSVEEAVKNGGEKYFNLVDPPHRDGFTLYAGEGKFVVVRYEITFPAVSMLHCHMIHHFAVCIVLFYDNSVFLLTSTQHRAGNRSFFWRGWRSCRQFHKNLKTNLTSNSISQCAMGHWTRKETVKLLCVLQRYHPGIYSPLPENL